MGDDPQRHRRGELPSARGYSASRHRVFRRLRLGFRGDDQAEGAPLVKGGARAMKVIRTRIARRVSTAVLLVTVSMALGMAGNAANKVSALRVGLLVDGRGGEPIRDAVIVI